jgi:DNA repair protein RadC
MTVTTLFGEETIPAKPRTIKFKQIKAVYENLIMHVSEEITNYLSPKTRYTSPSQVFESFKWLQSETKEYFIVLHLDGKNRPLAADLCSIGSLNQSIVNVREVYKVALLSSAACILVLHNHPSLDETPSSEDIAITRRLKEAGELLNVKLIDHIIIGETYLSFVERGLM